MSRFFHLAKRVTKTLVSLVDANSSATPTVGTWPSGVTGRVKITLSKITGHADITGSVTVNGEAIDFNPTASATSVTKVSSTELTAKPTITTANIDCHIHITVIDQLGADVYASTETDLPCTIKLVSRGVQTSDGTWSSVKSTEIRARGTFSINDIIKFDITNFFDPTNGIERPIKSWKPDKGLMGRENIKILEF